MSRNKLKEIENVVRNIESDIAVLEARIAQLREWHRSAVEYQKFAEREESTAEALPALYEPSMRHTRVRTPVVQVKAVRNALFEILRESDGPMHPTELLPQLAQRGLLIEGDRDKATGNLRSHLSHDVRFHSVGSGKWDLVSRPSRFAPPYPKEQPRSMHADPAEQNGIPRDIDASARDFEDIPF